MKDFYFCIYFKEKGKNFYYKGYYKPLDPYSPINVPAVSENISEALKLDYEQEAKVICNSLSLTRHWKIKEVIVN